MQISFCFFIQVAEAQVEQNSCENTNVDDRLLSNNVWHTFLCPLDEKSGVLSYTRPLVQISIKLFSETIHDTDLKVVRVVQYQKLYVYDFQIC